MTIKIDSYMNSPPVKTDRTPDEKMREEMMVKKSVMPTKYFDLCLYNDLI